MLYNRGMENPYCTGKKMTAMFKYANYDYDSLLHNADGIDPESADALYALAQFCRTGKGCQISYEAYRHYLQRAADRGNAKAAGELEATAPTGLLGKFYAAVFGPQSYGAFVFAGAYRGIIVRIIVGIFTIPYHSIFYRNEARMEREREAVNHVNPNEEEKRWEDAILRDGFMADYRNGVDADLDRYGKLLLLLRVAAIVLSTATVLVSSLLYGVVSRLGGIVSAACIVLDIVWVVRIYKNVKAIEEIATTGQEPEPSLARSLYIFRKTAKGREKVAYYDAVFCGFACSIYTPFFFKPILTAWMRVASMCRF